MAGQVRGERQKLTRAKAREALEAAAQEGAEVEAWQEEREGCFWNGSTWEPLESIATESPVPTPDMTRRERKALGKVYRAAEEQRLIRELEERVEERMALPAKLGRPSGFNEDIAREICERLATGQSMGAIAELEHMPTMPTMWAWIRKEPAFFSDYMRAREEQAHVLFDQCLDIADDTANDLLVAEDGTVTANTIAVTRAKLRIDTRMRMAAKMSPKVYSERSETLGLGGGTVNVQVNAMTIDARTLDSDSRDNLRRLLLEAKANAIDV
jgi:hypothetical protein